MTENKNYHEKIINLLKNNIDNKNYNIDKEIEERFIRRFINNKKTYKWKIFFDLTITSYWSWVITTKDDLFGWNKNIDIFNVDDKLSLNNQKIKTYKIIYDELNNFD